MNMLTEVTSFINYDRTDRLQLTSIYFAPDNVIFCRYNPVSGRHLFSTYHPRPEWREILSTLTFSYHFRAYMVTDENHEMSVSCEPLRSKHPA